MTPFEQASDFIVKTARDVHYAAVTAGWWSDPTSGESLIGKRDFISMCGLIVTEITEAYDGWQMSAMDDKLPHREQVEVELADAFIRMGDTSVGCGVDLQAGLDLMGPTFVPFTMPSSIEHALLTITGFVSYAIEGQRKRDVAKRDINMAKAMYSVGVLAGNMGLDLRGAVLEKMAFNAIRPDHKLENRMAEGGKKE